MIISRFKLFLAIFCVFFLTSCVNSNIRFVEPQPVSLDALETIPKNYQGVFSINNDTVIVTENSIDGITISDSLIVKKLGNYLYINQLEYNNQLDMPLYLLSCVKLVNCWSNEQITFSRFNIDLFNEEISNEIFTNIDTINLSVDSIEFLYFSYISKNQLSFLKALDMQYLDDNIIGLYDDNFVLENININEFQTLLNRSEQKIITRIK